MAYSLHIPHKKVLTFRSVMRKVQYFYVEIAGKWGTFNIVVRTKHEGLKIRKALTLTVLAWK